MFTVGFILTTSAYFTFHSNLWKVFVISNAVSFHLNTPNNIRIAALKNKNKKKLF